MTAHGDRTLRPHTATAHLIRDPTPQEAVQCVLRADRNNCLPMIWAHRWPFIAAEQFVSFWTICDHLLITFDFCCCCSLQMRQACCRWQGTCSLSTLLNIFAIRRCSAVDKQIFAFFSDREREYLCKLQETNQRQIERERRWVRNELKWRRIREIED